MGCASCVKQFDDAGGCSAPEDKTVDYIPAGCDMCGPVAEGWCGGCNQCIQKWDEDGGCMYMTAGSSAEAESVIPEGCDECGVYALAYCETV